MSVKLTQSGVSQIRSELRKIGKKSRSEAVNRVPTQDPFWVKLTTFTGGIYQWKRQIPDKTNPGKFKDPGTAVTGTNAHMPGLGTSSGAGDLIGKWVRIKFLCYDSSKAPHFVILGAASNAAMQVDLTQVGGTDGNATTACSYTYTPKDLSGNAVKDASGTTLAAMTPTHNRPIGKTTAAKQGILVTKPDGSIVLRWTDEVPNKIKRSC